MQIMTGDLVKRLRKEEDSLYGTHPCGLLHDAADRIEALEKALREVISVSDRKTDIYDRARAALEGKDEQ
jgi:hypothetical protein